MSIPNSKDFIKAIKKNPENFYLIHYSCQSLNDDNDALSPRITSIAELITPRSKPSASQRIQLPKNFIYRVKKSRAVLTR
jgi:hypothetical protein